MKSKFLSTYSLPQKKLINTLRKNLAKRETNSAQAKKNLKAYFSLGRSRPNSAPHRHCRPNQKDPWSSYAPNILAAGRYFCFSRDLYTCELVATCRTYEDTRLFGGPTVVLICLSRHEHIVASRQGSGLDAFSLNPSIDSRLASSFRIDCLLKMIFNRYRDLTYKRTNLRGTQRCAETPFSRRSRS